eukprot:149070_1
MTSIMGCTIEGQDRSYFEQWYKCLVLKPRLIHHLQTFKDYPIPLKHAARFAKIIIVLCDRVYTEWFDINTTKEGKQTQEIKQDDVADDVDGESTTTTKENEIFEIEEKKTVDGVGPYLKNKNKPRCLDDIAFIAMRSLEMWTKYNEAIVCDALRVVGETITDFEPNFIFAENEDVRTVNSARWVMAIDILKKVLRFSQTNIRHKYLPVITEIVDRFHNVINAPLDDFINIYQDRMDVTDAYNYSDEFAQSRLYISQMLQGLNTFFDKMGSFYQVPIDYYSTLLLPLDNDDSRGMYTDIMMKKRWEMLSNNNTKNDERYFDLVVDFVQDLIYYGCLDANFAINQINQNAERILHTLKNDQQAEIMKILIKDTFPKRKATLYLPEILQSESYSHLRHNMIMYIIFDRRVINVSTLQQFMDEFIEYFVERMELLNKSIGGDDTNSHWRLKKLNYNEIDNEIHSWGSYITSVFTTVDFHNNAQLSYMQYSLVNSAKKIYDIIWNKVTVCAFSKESFDTLCSVENWIYIKLFKYVWSNHPNIIMVAYHEELISLLTISIYLGQRKFITDKTNPFPTKHNIIENLSKIWSLLKSSYFSDCEKKKYLLINTIFDWLFDHNKLQDLQQQIPSFRENIVSAAIHCLSNDQHKCYAWNVVKNVFVKLWDVLCEEKSKKYVNKRNTNDETKEESEIQIKNYVKIRTKVAVDLYYVLNQQFSLMKEYTHDDITKKLYNIDSKYIEPLLQEILNRASSKNDYFHQKVLLLSIKNNTTQLVNMLPNRTQELVDICIRLVATSSPKDAQYTYAVTECKKNVEKILRASHDKQKLMIIKKLIQDTLKKETQTSNLKETLKIKHSIIQYMICDRRVFDGSNIQQFIDLFIEYFQYRMKLLSDTIEGTIEYSDWIFDKLTNSKIDNEINAWINFITSMFRIKFNFISKKISNKIQKKANATLMYNKISKKIYDVIYNKVSVCAFNKESMSKLCSIEDWIYFKLFKCLVQSHMNILVVAYESEIMKLLKISMYLSPIKFANNRKNPFPTHCNIISQTLNDIWGYVSSSYFHKDWKKRRKLLITQIFEWLFNKNSSQEISLFRNNVVSTCISCLGNPQYQMISWNIVKDKCLKLWHVLVEEKLIRYMNENMEEETKQQPETKVEKEQKDKKRSNIAGELYNGVLQKLIAFINNYKNNKKYKSHINFQYIKPILTEILNKSLSHTNNFFDQTLFLLLIKNHSRDLLRILPNEIQNIFDLSIHLSITSSEDDGGGILSSSNIVRLIEDINSELSPEWRKKKVLHKTLTLLIENIYDVVINTPLRKMKSLNTKQKWYRNICIILLTDNVHLIQYALTNKLASALKYYIDLSQIHLNLTKNDYSNICYHNFGSYITVLQQHIEILNPNLYNKRSIDPISG